MKKTTIISILVTTLFLVSCNIFDEGMVENISPPKFDLRSTALTLSDLQNVSFVVGLDSILYIGNVDSTNFGVYSYNTNRDSILGFWEISRLPSRSAVILEDSLLIIGNSDYKVGSLSLINTKSQVVVSRDYKTVHQDHDLIKQDKKVFLLERSLGVITGFTGGILNSESVFLNQNLGLKSNPQDVRVVESKTYVALYGFDTLIVFDNTNNTIVKTKIGLSSVLIEGQSSSNARTLAHYSNKLFVSIQRLTGFKALDTSKIVVIPLYNATQSMINLKFKNPISGIQQGKYLYLSSTTYTDTRGGIERVDLETLETTVIQTEEELGGSISSYYPVSETVGFARVLGSNFKYFLVEVTL